MENSPTHKRNAPGRPRKAKKRNKALVPGNLNRTAIIGHALELTREQSLQDLSLVKLASNLNVRAGTIHYHLGSREALLTGVLNLFFHELLTRVDAAALAEKTPPQQIEQISQIWLAIKIEYSGITHYIIAEDRFRLFQDPAEGEPDNGAHFADRVFTIMKRGNLADDDSAELWHLLALLTTATAEHITRHHTPSSHGSFLMARVEQYGEEKFPGLAFGIPALARLDVQRAFDRQLQGLIASFFKETGS